MKLLKCSFFNPLFILLSQFQKGISLGPVLNVAEKVSRQSQTLKTYLVFYISTQNMKGRRILNLMLTSIFQASVLFISFKNAILISVLVPKCCIWTSAEKCIMEVSLLGYTGNVSLIKEVFLKYGVKEGVWISEIWSNERLEKILTKVSVKV